uniref:Uncharacterized protein n=1 Tax=Megaviridae environmental sample TaxID=1737588 RepID=A0A5J6VIW1_9VIRU|nr:MAG: hypothetical protein [Megaviridae environmental sample]
MSKFNDYDLSSFTSALSSIAMYADGNNVRIDVDDDNYSTNSKFLDVMVLKVNIRRGYNDNRKVSLEFLDDSSREFIAAVEDALHKNAAKHYNMEEQTEHFRLYSKANKMQVWVNEGVNIRDSEKKNVDVTDGESFNNYINQVGYNSSWVRLKIKGMRTWNFTDENGNVSNGTSIDVAFVGAKVLPAQTEKTASFEKLEVAPTELDACATALNNSNGRTYINLRANQDGRSRIANIKLSGVRGWFNEYGISLAISPEDAQALSHIDTLISNEYNSGDRRYNPLVSHKEDSEYYYLNTYYPTEYQTNQIKSDVMVTLDQESVSQKETLQEANHFENSEVVLALNAVREFTTKTGEDRYGATMRIVRAAFLQSQSDESTYEDHPIESYDWSSMYTEVNSDNDKILFSRKDDGKYFVLSGVLKKGGVPAEEYVRGNEDVSFTVPVEGEALESFQRGDAYFGSTEFQEKAFAHLDKTDDCEIIYETPCLRSDAKNMVKFKLSLNDNKEFKFKLTDNGSIVSNFGYSDLQRICGVGGMTDTSSPRYELVATINNFFVKIEEEDKKKKSRKNAPPSKVKSIKYQATFGLQKLSMLPSVNDDRLANATLDDDADEVSQVDKVSQVDEHKETLPLENDTDSQNATVFAD